MRARGKVGSIEVVVDIEIVVGKIVVDDVDDEEPESENGVEIEVGSRIEGTAVELGTELEISPRLCWIWKKRRSIEVEMHRSEEVRSIHLMQLAAGLPEERRSFPTRLKTVRLGSGPEPGSSDPTRSLSAPAFSIQNRPSPPPASSSGSFPKYLPGLHR